MRSHRLQIHFFTHPRQKPPADQARCPGCGNYPQSRQRPLKRTASAPAVRRNVRPRPAASGGTRKTSSRTGRRGHRRSTLLPPALAPPTFHNRRPASWKPAARDAITKRPAARRAPSWQSPWIWRAARRARPVAAGLDASLSRMPRPGRPPPEHAPDLNAGLLPGRPGRPGGRGRTLAFIFLHHYKI